MKFSSLRTSILGGAALIAVCTSQALAADAPHTIFDDIKGFDVSAEGGFLMGSGNLPYAQYYDNVKDYAFVTGPGNGWNAKLGLTAHMDSGWDFSAHLSSSRSTGSAATASYDGHNTPVSWPVYNILGFQKDAGPTGATSYNSATVTTDIRTNMIDLDAGHDIGLGGDGDLGELKLIGGVRIASFEQNSGMDLFCSNSPGSTGPGGCTPTALEVAQTRKSRFSGLGPQLGFDYKRPLTEWNIGLFGSGLASIIVGKERSDTYSHWVSGSPDPTQGSFGENRAAYMLEANAGVSYNVPNCPVVMAVGYQVQWAANVRDTANEAAANGSGGKFGSHSADLFYHGPFLRLTYTVF